MEKELLFTEEEWNVVQNDVVRQMTDFLRPYRTPIYEHLNDHGKGWGSGSYIKLGSHVFILTNEHVSRVREVKVLAHQFDGQEDIRRIVGDHIEYPAPLDTGLLPVDMVAWPDPSNSSKAIDIKQIALAHTPVPYELLTFTGFAGDKVDFHFNTLYAEGTCYTAREVQLPDHPDIDSRFHFGIDYRPDLATDVIGTGGLPPPPGLSGSTVWNTAVVEAKMRGVEWTPNMARVTGVVWGWPSNAGCLVATRIEYVRSFLLDAVHVLGLRI